MWFRARAMTIQPVSECKGGLGSNISKTIRDMTLGHNWNTNRKWGMGSKVLTWPLTLTVLNNYAGFAQLKAWWRLRGKNVNSHPDTCVCIPVSYTKAANINVKKLQFSHLLTALTDTPKTAKMIKRWYYSASHWRLGDVMVANVTFWSFLLLSMCHVNTNSR